MKKCPNYWCIKDRVASALRVILKMIKPIELIKTVLETMLIVVIIIINPIYINFILLLVWILAKIVEHKAVNYIHNKTYVYTI